MRPSFLDLVPLDLVTLTGLVCQLVGGSKHRLSCIDPRSRDPGKWRRDQVSSGHQNALYLRVWKVWVNGAWNENARKRLQTVHLFVTDPSLVLP